MSVEAKTTVLFRYKTYDTVLHPLFWAKWGLLEITPTVTFRSRIAKYLVNV